MQKALNVTLKLRSCLKKNINKILAKVRKRRRRQRRRVQNENEEEEEKGQESPLPTT